MELPKPRETPRPRGWARRSPGAVPAVRRLAVFCGSFAAGIFLAQYLLPEEGLLPCALGALALALGRLAAPGAWGRRLLLAGTGLSLALGWDWLYARQVQRPMEALAGSEGTAVMSLCGYPEAAGYGARATVRIAGLPGKAVYYGDEALLELRPGGTVTGRVLFQSAARIRDDDITAFTSKGVFLLAYGRGRAEYAPGTEPSPRWWPVRLGRAVGEKLRAIFNGDTAGFLAAMLTGDRSGLSARGEAALSEAGLSHLLAVSGMHCGFLLTLAAALTGRHRRRLTALCGISLLAFYAAMAGMTPSVLRACVMLALFLAAPLAGRESDGPTSLAAALFLILLANPFAAGSISLQLSFAAAAGVLCLTRRLYRLLAGDGRRGRIFRLAASSVSATLGALVFTAPLAGWYFGTLPLVSPVSSLLCLWAASAAFLTGLVTAALSFLWMPLASLTAWVPALLARYILGVAGLLSRLPYHAAYFENPYLKYWMAFAYLLFFTAWRSRRAPARKYALAAFLAAAALAVTLRLGEGRFRGGLDAVALDVGQGQCVLLASEGSFALVDCGSGSGWYPAGEIAARYLGSLGCRKLDYLILTHYDSDHVNGVEALLARLDVDTLAAPEAGDGAELRPVVLAAAERHGVEVQTVTELEEAPLGRAALTVYPPVGTGGGNETGLAVLASCAGDRLLVTGDMGAATERSLLERYDLPEAAYLMAGHHGSRTSTSDALLDAVEPEAVLISVGPNSYGHPAEETLKRLARRGCAVYRTDLHGSIHLTMGD